MPCHSTVAVSVMRSTTPRNSSPSFDGELEDKRVGLEDIPDHVDALVKVGPGSVHLVHEGNPRNPVSVSLSPDRL